MGVFLLVMGQGSAVRAQAEAARGLLAVLSDLPVGTRAEVLDALRARWPGTHVSTELPPPAGLPVDPLAWGAVFRTPGLDADPPHGSTITCIRFGPVTHAAILQDAPRTVEGRIGQPDAFDHPVYDLLAIGDPWDWPRGAVARMVCEGGGIYWGNDTVGPLLDGAEARWPVWDETVSAILVGSVTVQAGTPTPSAPAWRESLRLAYNGPDAAVPGVTYSVGLRLFAMDR